MGPDISSVVFQFPLEKLFGFTHLSVFLLCQHCSISCSAEVPWNLFIIGEIIYSIFDIRINQSYFDDSVKLEYRELNFYFYWNSFLYFSFSILMICLIHYIFIRYTFYMYTVCVLSICTVYILYVYGILYIWVRHMYTVCICILCTIGYTVYAYYMQYILYSVCRLLYIGCIQCCI